MPKLLKLISLEAFDLQSGSASYQFDLLRLIVVLDGQPVKWLGWHQYRGVTTTFSESDNLTDEDRTGAERPFVYWSLADVTVYEADTAGSNVGWDYDTDEWIQTVRIDHRDSLSLEVGSESQLSYLAPGRSDCRYVLTYSLEDIEVPPDNAFFRRIEGADPESEFLVKGETTGDLETDKGDCKWICAIDGGGLRGIFPLRVLEQLEHYYGRSCFEIFDMFAGTSTGSMIAAALASGRPLRDVIALYTDDTTRQDIFASNHAGQHHAFRYLDLKRLSGAGANEDTLDNALSASWLSDKVESSTGALNRLINQVGEQLMTPRY